MFSDSYYMTFISFSLCNDINFPMFQIIVVTVSGKAAAHCYFAVAIQ